MKKKKIHSLILHKEIYYMKENLINLKRVQMQNLKMK